MMAESGLVFWTKESQTGILKANPSGVKHPTNLELINDDGTIQPLRLDISLVCQGHLSII